VLGTPVLGLVTLNALLAQSSFRVDDLEQRIQNLSQENLELTTEHAKLSAPGRIAAWARRHGMRLPDDIRFLHVSSAESTAAPAGDADPLARQEESLKPVLGGGA
jgi:cell division protein FtsL